jgi:hypothetical protein
VLEYQLFGVLLGVLLGLPIRRGYSVTRLLGRLVAGMQIYIQDYSLVKLRLRSNSILCHASITIIILVISTSRDYLT